MTKMNNSRCLYCYLPLEPPLKDFHKKCCKKMFGVEEAPIFEMDSEGMQKLADKIVLRSVAVTGVQPKLSLTIESDRRDKRSRFTIVRLWGKYILKPQTEEFPFLPENEDLTMHLAEI